MFLHPQNVLDHFNIAEGMKVADFGSGHGHFAIPIARKVGPYGRVYAIDVIPDSLDQLRGESLGEGLSHVHFVHNNLESSRGSMLSDESVDRVIIVNTLFSIENKEKVLEEAHRVLRSKGLLAIIDWKDSFGNIGPHKEHVVTFEEALILALDAGFDLYKEFSAGDMHYGLVFKLPS